MGTASIAVTLRAEGNYKIVREMQQKNLIVPLVGDFAGPKAIQAVGEYLKAHNSTLSIFYLSNVEQYLVPAPTLMRFYEQCRHAAFELIEQLHSIRTGYRAQPGIVQSYSSPMQAWWMPSSMAARRTLRTSCECRTNQCICS